MLTLRGHKVPPKAKETLHARTGRELKPEHYDTSAAQPRAGANTCTGQVPAPHRQWSLPDTGNEDVVPPPKRVRSVSAYVDQQTSGATPLAEGTGASSAPPIVEGSGAIATSDAQQSTGADVDQQTSDATPLAEERVGQPLHTNSLAERKGRCAP